MQFQSILFILTLRRCHMKKPFVDEHFFKKDVRKRHIYTLLVCTEKSIFFALQGSLEKQNSILPHVFGSKCAENDINLINFSNSPHSLLKSIGHDYDKVNEFVLLKIWGGQLLVYSEVFWRKFES